jgi:hypothetical protein
MDEGEERIGDEAIQAQIRFQARKVMIQATALTFAITTATLLLPG